MAAKNSQKGQSLSVSSRHKFVLFYFVFCCSVLAHHKEVFGVPGISHSDYNFPVVKHCLGCLHPVSECLDLSPSSTLNSNFLLKCILETGWWWLKRWVTATDVGDPDGDPGFSLTKSCLSRHLSSDEGMRNVHLHVSFSFRISAFQIEINK